MQILQGVNPDLHDAEPTIKFIRRMSKLIRVMMSRTPVEALQWNTNRHQILKNFRNYLDVWEKQANENGYRYLPANTSYGLKVTINATLEILEFLTLDEDYKFLLTSRLNQDALERFFSLARGVCGSNDHPDSILFGQMFRLMSSYSLIKPCKGSNVAGGEMIRALLKFDDLSQTADGRKEWEKIMDSVIESGNCKDLIATNGTAIATDHGTTVILHTLMAYMAGYVVRKASKWTKCRNCVESVQSTDKRDESHALISMLSHGYLIYPSADLIQLLEIMEEHVLATVNSTGINCDTVFHISYALQESSLPLVGCPEHTESFTILIMKFFIRVRAEFLAKRFNKIHSDKKLKTRKCRKDSKL